MERKKIVKIDFNKKIYKLKAARRAIADYQDVAGLKFTENKSYFQVEFKNMPKEFDSVIADEFGNYILALMINSQ